VQGSQAPPAQLGWLLLLPGAASQPAVPRRGPGADLEAPLETHLLLLLLLLHLHLMPLHWLGLQVCYCCYMRVPCRCHQYWYCYCLLSGWAGCNQRLSGLPISLQAAGTLLQLVT
jgi:hypothetical protein